MSAKNGHATAAMIIAAASTIALPASATAQAVTVRGESASNPVADALHARAEALYTIPARYADAARLLVRAANAREHTDVLAVKELITAAKLYSYANAPRSARSTMKIAAQRALEFGDVATSAHTYIDAAFLAIPQKDWGDVADLVVRAQRLAAAPHLNDDERVGILQRITPVRIALRTAGR